MSSDTSPLAAAIGYAGLGWKTFPLAYNSKKPPRGSNGHNGATSDLDALYSKFNGWDGNIGVATGDPSGIWVLDIDPMKGGTDNLLNYGFGPEQFPETASCSTPRRGTHYYFKVPPGATIWSREGVLHGVDVRGNGGYAALPPSNINNVPYEWFIGLDPLVDNVEIAYAPPELLALVLAASPEQSSKTKFMLPSSIPEGERNGTLFRYACSLWARDMSVDEVSQRVHSANTANCDSPLPEREVFAILKSVTGRYPPGMLRKAPKEPVPGSVSVAEIGGSTQEYHLTEVGNVERFVDLYRGELRYCAAYGRWVFWDGRRWVVDETGGYPAYTRAIAMFRQMQEGAEYIDRSKTENKDAPMTDGEWAYKCETKSRVQALITLAQVHRTMPIVPDDMDTEDWEINTPAGIVDLRSGTIGPHRIESLHTKITRVSPDFGGGEPEQFNRFLDQIMLGREDLVDWIWRYIGYTLTGVTTEHIFAFMYGSGGNGKGVLGNIIHHMLGDYAQSVPRATLVASQFQSSIPNDVARLKGIRMARAEETEEGKRLAEAFVKEVTGDSPISARFMRGEFFDFKPKFKLWLAGNHKPIIRNFDDAIARRICVIPFDWRVSEETRDTMLESKLLMEAPLIFAKAVLACLKWQDQGIPRPQPIIDAISEYRAEMDTIANFMQTCIEEDSMAEIQAGQLYTAYQQWCIRGGERFDTITMFGRKVKAKGVPFTQRSGYTWYQGIKIKRDEMGLFDNDPYGDDR